MRLSLAVSIALLAFASSGWKVYSQAPFLTPPAPKFTDAERHSELARRRAAVAAKMADNSLLILLSAEPKLYTNDVDYPYRQENNLYHLTELKQKNAILVISKRAGKLAEFIFVPKPDPANETWNGHMYTFAEASAVSGIKDVRDAVTWAAFMKSLLPKARSAYQRVYMLNKMPENSDDADGEREFRREHALARQLVGYKIEDAGPIFAEMRQIKSAYEQRMLQHAIDMSIEAHEQSWLAARTATMEYELQAEAEYIFRKRNADFWGYPSIVGCGANATTLHYEESQSPLIRDGLCLMDVGAEYGHYSADVTRTFPVSGKFSKEQADIYQIVYDAQEAVARAAKPGATVLDLSSAASEVLTEGLIRLGLMTARDDTQLRVWYMHDFGHWLGMNVHDVGPSWTLKSGMTFTNEPGIYIRADALDNLPDTAANREFKQKVRPAFERYKNIGVRIEDDMTVTETGVRWMTAALPRKMSEIEAFMAANKK
ncbi:MAG TPA: Xaa-Pro aminopeptidase [Pyrinomonadaceae bacterium]|nr:Xaa-Pro aminopeptidase [Pyrinomonadaceae bacterium]